jgi:hypothetical protein
MGLSRSRCTADMGTTTTLVDDTSRGSIGYIDGLPATARRNVRRAAAAGVGERTEAEPQVVDIWVDGGYQPAQSVAVANVPLRLVFHRRDADHCTERVVFSSPHIERRLTANGTTVVDLPGQSAGIVRFTCGMGRYRGEIALVERRTTVGGRRWIPGLAAASVGAVTVLAGIGIVSVEVAAGFGALIAGATAVLLAAWRSSRAHPSYQR